MIGMNRRVQALACVFCLFCLTATATSAQSPNHHRPAAPPRHGHPKPAQRVLPASRHLAPFVAVPCFALDDAALDPACSDDPNAAGDRSTPTQTDLAPSLPAPAAAIPAAAPPSSIQPQPPSLVPPAPGSANGTLRLDVEPPSTQVFVDGFYAGSVAEINDRGLALGAGWHRLVFRSPGYETASANVTVEPNRTTTYHLAWHQVSST